MENFKGKGDRKVQEKNEKIVARRAEEKKY